MDTDGIVKTDDWVARGDCVVVAESITSWNRTKTTMKLILFLHKIFNALKIIYTITYILNQAKLQAIYFWL